MAFRLPFSSALTDHPNIEIRREEIAGLPPEDWQSVIIATGPLTSPALAEAVRALTGEEALAFFDAIAPIVHRESIDFDIAWMQSRYDKKGPGGGDADYINCPLDEDQYHAFVAALLAGEKTDFKEWEKIHALFRRLPAHRSDGGARRRHAALRADEAGRASRPAHGPPPLCGGAAAPGQRAGHAVEHGGLPDQAETWRADAHLPHDPGLENAQFARLGGLHRNTFINSPRCSTRNCG